MRRARSARAEAISVRAHAKINLSLRVIARRPDGYHDVRTVLQSLALHDTLTFHAVRGPFAITCDDSTCPTDRSNLVWQAAASLWRAGGRRGRPDGVRVHIAKRIPLQAGLGGGSSDAAAAIRALSRLWRIDLREEAQAALAADLGSDVSFFLRGGTALGLDRGEVLFPLADIPPHRVVVVVPPFGVSTSDAYGWWDETTRTAPRRPSAAPAAAVRESFGFAAPVTELRNDLEAPVAARHAAIGRAIRALVRAGARYAAMSGSGSAVFGLFPSRDAARAGAASAGRWGRIVLTRTIDRQAYDRQARPDAADSGR